MAHYTQLLRRERSLIAIFSSMDIKVSLIAERMGRHRSTIYRELKRNKVGAQYLPGQAHALSKQRHSGPPNKIEVNHDLNKFVIEGLTKGWSPEQISGRMLRLKEEFYACHESIYRYVYKNKEQGFYKLLPRQKPYRCFKKLKNPQQKSQILKKNICYRPDEAKLRNIFGHWEGDTMHFTKDQKSCVTTLIERKSRFIFLRKNKNKGSQEVTRGMYSIFKSSPKKLWRTMTLDQGSEFMSYHWLERETKYKIFFCDPHSPWQRGSNENMNGRLRRYMPQKFKIDETEQETLDIIAIRVNNTPRKCLGYRTPREVLRKCWRALCRTSV